MQLQARTNKGPVITLREAKAKATEREEAKTLRLINRILKPRRLHPRTGSQGASGERDVVLASMKGSAQIGTPRKNEENS